MTNNVENHMIMMMKYYKQVKPSIRTYEKTGNPEKLVTTYKHIKAELPGQARGLLAELEFYFCEHNIEVKE